jgi:hypothetical protein
MSILSNLLHKVFSSKAPAAQSPPTAGATPPAPTPAANAPAPTPAANAPAAPQVDVAAVLDAAVASKGQKLAWRTSIVDLMKAIDLDSSLSARKDLAGELNYDGDTDDSAAMNVWLHKQVMKKLAENGGKVPSELRT